MDIVVFGVGTTNIRGLFSNLQPFTYIGRTRGDLSVGLKIFHVGGDDMKSNVEYCAMSIPAVRGELSCVKSKVIDTGLFSMSCSVSVQEHTTSVAFRHSCPHPR